MITDEIMDALVMLASRTKSKHEQYAIACVMSMLEDFCQEDWQTMDENERKKWIKKYI